MADKITLKSSSFDGRYMQLVCTQTSNGGAKNTSTIKWTLSTVGGNEDYYSTGATKVIINGTTVYSKPRVAWDDKTFPASKGSKSGEIEVSHKSDGTKSIKVSFSTAIYTSTVSEYEETWKLDPIARYGTSTQSLNSKTETSIKMNWASDNTVDYIWYSTDNGENWTGKNVTDGKSGTYTISDLKANTTYKIKTRIRRKDSQLTTDSSALSVTTYNYPYCTESPNFILGNSVTLKFYNPLKRAFNFYIIGNGTQIDVEYDCDSTSYTGVTSTSSSVPYLYKTIPNAKSGKYKVKVVYGSHTHTRDNGNTYSIKESECYPNFTTFTYKDTNATVTAVTGNNQALVKGLSTVTVEIPLANRMTTKNSATPKKYVANIGKVNKDIAYSSTGAVSVAMGTISTIGTQRITITAYDSRELPKQAYKDVTVYDYSKPVINASAKRLNNFENQTTLKVSGTYSRLTIGGTDKNKINSVEYRYRESGGSWGSWTPLNTTLSSGKFTCNDVVFSLDNAKAFEFEVRATDNLSNNTKPVIVDIGQAIFFVSSNKKTAYLNGEEVATSDNVRQDLYPVGTVYCSSTNTNPSSKFGGTWTLIDKGFNSSISNDNSAFTPSTNVAVDTCFAGRGGSTLRVRLSVIINDSITDTGMELGTLNFGKIGISGLGYGVTGGMAYSDGANGGIIYNVNYSTGAITQVDVFDLTPIPTGNKFSIDFTVPIMKDLMLDSFCDKFYWKRTA